VERDLPEARRMKDLGITEADVREGLVKDEFFLEYMPIVSLAARKCVGAEALIRWRRPTGVVPPGLFIPQIEGTPVSGLVTYWVIERIAAELSAWLSDNGGAYVSFNVPPEILGRGGLEHTATKAGLMRFASQVVLEITERGVPDALGLNAIEATWGTRVRVALDDVTFAGGANLAILSRAQFSMLKLDRSLVSQISPGYTAPAWLTGLAAMLNSSHLEVIAEGVETQLQADVLRDAGVQSGQGWFFAKSLLLPAFLEYFRKERAPSPTDVRALEPR
jgi:sensor c-di-GMP phosphodiesterase-like protein